MQLYMRRYGSQSVAAGSDAAVAAWPLPAECTFNYLKGQAHLIISTAVALINAHSYSLQGWILKSNTNADFGDMDTLWDRFVPKDDDTVDLDADVTADTSSMYELSQINVAQLLNQEVGGPHRFFNKSELITVLNGHTNLLTSTNTYFPNDFVELNMNKKFTARDNSGILFGVGSPDMADVGVDDDVIDSLVGVATDNFFMLKQIDDFLDKAMISATPFTETGAESPYEDTMNFLLETLEKVNENTGLFTSGSWVCWIKAMAGIRTPGRIAHTSIGPDAQA